MIAYLLCHVTPSVARIGRYAARSYIVRLIENIAQCRRETRCVRLRYRCLWCILQLLDQSAHFRSYHGAACANRGWTDATLAGFAVRQQHDIRPSDQFADLVLRHPAVLDSDTSGGAT